MRAVRSLFAFDRVVSCEEFDRRIVRYLIELGAVRSVVRNVRYLIELEL